MHKSLPGSKAARALKAAAKNKSMLALPLNYKRQDHFFADESDDESERRQTNNQRLLE